MRISLFIAAVLLFLSRGGRSIYGMEEDEDGTCSVYESGEIFTDDIWEGVSLDDAESIADEAGIDFSEILNEVYNVDSETETLQNRIVSYILGSISINWRAIRRVFLLACLGAMLSSLSDAFKSRQIGEMGFYICYLCLMGIIIAAFSSTLETVSDLLELLLRFMRALLPAYYFCLALAIGSADGYYACMLTALTLTERIIELLLIPGVKLYLLIMLLNYILQKDSLSKLAELIKTILSWTMKSIFTFVLGMQTIESFISPYKAFIAENILIKAAKAIPGVGNSVGAISSVVAGSAVLIKNTVGLGAIIVITLMCCSPLIQTGCSALIYQACAGLIQPFADRRMVMAVDAAGKSIRLLLNLALLIVLMLIITLTILCAVKPDAIS